MATYGLKYTIPCSNTDGISCVIEIEEIGYTGTSKELTAGESPFSVSVEDADFCYTPLRTSTAKIGIVGSDYLQDLFTTTYQLHRVTFIRNGRIEWCGFIKPEAYTQEYVAETFSLELECTSSVKTLEHVDYTNKEGSKQFVSLWYLLKKCIAASNGRYTGVYVPYVYAATEAEYTAGTGNVIDNMTVSEQNFYDEDGTPMKLSEVMESLMKLLGWTMYDYLGDLYIIDADHTGTYRVYDTTLTEVKTTVKGVDVSVQDIGFKGGDHTLDILGGYTKVKVKDSNYPVGDVFPTEKWTAQMEIGQEYDHAILSPTASTGDTSFLVFVDQSPTNTLVYDRSDSGQKYDTYTSGNYSVRLPYLGSRLTRIYEISKKDNKKVEPDNTLEIDLQMCKWTDRTTADVYKLLSGEIVFSFKKDLPTMALKDGCFYISGQVAQSTDRMNYIFSSDVGSKKNMNLVCALSVGPYYWNGNSWIKNSSIKNIESESTFKIPVTPKAQGFSPIDGELKYYQPYGSASGYIIPIPDTPLSGRVQFIMRAPECDDAVTAVFIKDFSIKFAKRDDMEIKESSGSDRTYENVVNADYINECDEIEFKITSYNKDGACYSKVMLGDSYLADNLYSAIEGKPVRPEEALIRRIIKRYSSPKVKLTQQLQFDSRMIPINTLSDKYMVNKRFILLGGNIDYSIDRYEAELVEH